MYNILYENSFEEHAEEHCEAAVMSALAMDSTNIEALQTLASLRLSQCRPNEASSILDQILSKVFSAIDKYESRNIADELMRTDEIIEELNGKCI